MSTDPPAPADRSASTRAPLAVPARRTCPFSPPAEYAGLREHAPVARGTQPDGHPIWTVSRHEDVRAMLTDPRFSSDFTHPAFPGLVPLQRQFGTDGPPPLPGMDAPEHTEARRAVLGEFTVRRMNALKPRIRQIVDEHVDAMLAGPRPCDLVEALSLPVPSLVVCELLGVPYEDHEFFQSRSGRLVRAGLPPDERKQAGDELRAYIDDLVRQKERRPGDDLLGRQILKQRRAGREDRGGLVSLALIMLIAGHETAANQIALGTLALLRHPALRRRLTDEPDAAPGVVEELLRYFTVAETVMSRVATEDVELGGVVIPAGQGVVALLNSANHDPGVFPRPDELDVDRGARHHLAFGYGAHQCIGQNLARLELQAAYGTLFRRIPGLRLAVPFDELSFLDDSAIYGVHELPVTW